MDDKGVRGKGGGQESTVLGFQDGPWEYGTICRAYLT